MTQSLADFVAQVDTGANLRVEENLGAGYYKLRISEAERRQAKHDIQCVEDIVIEMLRNARDAHAQHIFVATTTQDTKRTIVMLDDGDGIPKEMHQKIFDARVTSKLDTVHMDKWGVHGRGMALYSIAQNVEDIKVMASDDGLGSSFCLNVDTSKLPEKSDQSTWPVLSTGEDKNISLKGPRNIIRTICDFCLEEKKTCDVYIGSPAQIIATIRALFVPYLDTNQLLFCDDMTELGVLLRLCVPADARDLQAQAQLLGLDISERTAHRILSGSIKSERSAYAHLSHKKTNAPQEVDLLKDRRSLKVQKSDLSQFSRTMERAFSDFADKYYLTLQSEPRVHVTKNKVTVIFDIDEQD